jgi:hypothetical protein
MIDYDELIALCLEGDPIISDDDTTSMTWWTARC